MLLGLLPMIGTGCNDDSEIFYSVTYPIVRIEGVVTGTDTGGTNGTTGEDSDEPAENPLYTRIEAEVVAQAPVQAGGSYTLDFTKHNRGRAPIDTATEAGTVTGLFFKEPGVDSIRFYFLEYDYTCLRASYRDEEGNSLTRFTVDLTKEYTQRYPDAGITQVLRNEYTSTPY